MTLQSASVLVKMTIRQWDGFKKDRIVSDKADQVFQTAGNAGNYNKRLLDKAILAPIQKICNKIRFDHKFYTIPWCYDGVDLLPSKLYFDYTAVMRNHKDTYLDAVANLVAQYPIHKANQASKLGGMFNPEDYPDGSTLRARFDLSLQFFPVPAEGHYVLDLEAKETEKLKASLTQTLGSAQAEALRGVYDRVFELVEHTRERLSDPENVFRDSLLGNLEALVQVLPGLNIFGDVTLDEVTKRIKEQILFTSPEQLREDPDLRARVAENAYDISILLRT